MRRFHKLSAAGLLLFHCAIGPAQVAGDDVLVTDRLRARGEVEYEIRSGADCRIRWAVSRTGVNAGIAQLRSDCRLTMGEQLALQSKVLARVAADEPGLRTLFWGRLGKWPEWSARLALAATRSESWDAKAGQPKVGESMNAFVLTLMSQTDMFSELQQLLAGFAFANESVGHRKGVCSCGWQFAVLCRAFGARGRFPIGQSAPRLFDLVFRGENTKGR